MQRTVSYFLTILVLFGGLVYSADEQRPEPGKISPELEKTYQLYMLGEEISKSELIELENAGFELQKKQNNRFSNSVQVRQGQPNNSDINRTTYLSEGFDSAVPPTGWTETQTGTYGFQLYAYADADSGGANSLGGACAYHNDDSGDQVSWLISPALDLSGAVASRLVYQNRVDYSSYADSHNVKITTDGGTTWSMLESDILETGEANYEWYARTIDLSAYDGQSSVQIGFHYTGNYASEWHIDDVVVEETPQVPVADLFWSGVYWYPQVIGDEEVALGFPILKNGGSQDLLITSLASTAAGLTASTDQSTIAPGDTLWADLGFAPTSFGMSMRSCL